MSGRPLTLARSAIGEEEGLVGVKQWPEVRRMKRVEGLSARAISRRTGLARDVETYGPQAKPCAQYLAKGRQVAVSGRLEIQQYEVDGQKRSRTKVIGRVEFLGSRPEDDPDASIPF